ncbi:RCC1 domain-containing protein 1-like isoform X2 [Neoarius graeffei]|uniref:RCC1 domain-containing protein 1-like isoform X2 n=1 Tax=Neoarius graeffei TaxID=443677 RepID=UPI00298C917C|nr:RCC1 domain-containing protein 1-like isoform X2 [Neoarius graeffei]
MKWFGFGFNGFGQIKPGRKDEEEGMRVLSPVALLDSLCTCAETFSRTGLSRKQKTETQKVVASWSRTAVIHRTGQRRWLCEPGVEEQEEEQQETEESLSGVENSTPLKRLAVSLALGTGHAVLLAASGTVYTWGHGSHGQLGHGTLVSGDEPQAIEALWGVPMKSVAAGGWHSACISAGGDLYVWGWNESGQIGLPSKGLREERPREESIEKDKLKGNKKEDEGTSDVFISIQAFPALVDLSEAAEIKKVSCGSRHTAAITSTGDLYTWGWGFYGQLGHGSRCSSDEPKIVEFFSGGGMSVEDVTCGLWNTFVSADPRDRVAS